MGPRLALVGCQRQFNAAKRSAGVACTDAYLESGWGACVHSYADQAGNLVCIVAVDLEACKSKDGIEIAALLAHEAVHVWQRVRDMLGPGDLGKEMEAYAVQNIVSELMHGYVRLTNEKAARRRP